MPLAPQDLVAELARLSALVRRHKAGIKFHREQLHLAATELRAVEEAARARGCGVRTVLASPRDHHQA